MKLEEYKGKRNFRKTPEPPAELSEDFCKEVITKYKGKTLKHPVYVIQKHQASRLHYDLRLEESNTLTSWAIPKEPSENPKEKRLAVQTEDHPIEYANFKGTIPEGNYGAGKVEIWDKGTFEAIERTENKFIVNLKGKKLKGVYCLIKLRPKEDSKNWLFFKKK